MFDHEFFFPLNFYDSQIKTKDKFEPENIYLYIKMNTEMTMEAMEGGCVQLR